MEDITEYREQVLEVLKQSNNHYDTKIINLNLLNKDINYHRWLHPWQGDWEIEQVFTEEVLTNLSKILPPGSVAIDIGAHTGNMSVDYSLFADKVISFELTLTTLIYSLLIFNISFDEIPVPESTSKVVSPSPIAPSVKVNWVVGNVILLTSAPSQNKVSIYPVLLE